MKATFTDKLVYVFRINDKEHKGCLKIGETSFEELVYPDPNSEVLNQAAHERIKNIVQTAGIDYELLYTEHTTYKDGKQIKSFNDTEVHNVLKKSGIKQKDFPNGGREWFITDLNTVKNAIKAVKENRQSLLATEISQDNSPIIFRPEQKDAINETVKHFKKANKKLWNAKMRFGKTLCALEVVKQMNFKRTIIVTHRPVVDQSWFDDYRKIFYNEKNCYYGSKDNGEKFESLKKLGENPETKYIYFASMQDLRGSEQVGGKFDKNNDIFSTNWDCCIIDEAHEGTQTILGQKVIELLTKEKTKVLELSGTPFNLLDNHSPNEVYTWDYTMEQVAKKEWDEKNFGSANPYYDLPKLNICAYSLGELFKEYRDGESEKSFNFHEFFKIDRRTNKFIHEKDINKFLNLLCDKNPDSNYPFSTEEYRNYFRHTLWTLPGVQAAKALEELLHKHPVFSHFEIINVAGEGNADDDEKNYKELQRVKKAIGEDDPENLNNPDKSPFREGHYTITLTCGRLTTGVTVKSWTAVFLLSGSVNTQAASYMQTIFRVQSPAVICGKVKTDCYVFEFAPDRTLNLVAQAINASSKAGKTTDVDREKIKRFLDFCPVIAMKGSKMENYNVDTMISAIKKAQIERVVTSGFDDNRLYNFNLGDVNDEIFETDFKDLRGKIGTTQKIKTQTQIDITKNGLDQTETEIEDNIKPKTKKIDSEEQQKRKRRQECIAILRGISIRMPLMIYGANIKNEETITLQNFTDLIDDDSWKEFMPKQVTKEDFKKFSKYYDQDVFVQAGKRIREMVKDADNKSIDERVKLIALIFSYFRNPDKETVLTPWRVVNMHLSDCIGGYCFYDDFGDPSTAKQTEDEPHFVQKEGIAEEIFKTDAKILEINSKTGLYPLYMTYSIYRKHLETLLQYKDVIGLDKEKEQSLWDKTLKDNIFVVCRTPMACSITQRTLAGFRNVQTHIRCIAEIPNKENKNNFIKQVLDSKNFWNINNNNKMKFDAIVGNPPYQESDGGAQSSAKPLYHYFIDIAKHLKPNYISIIMPSRWMTGGKGLDAFRNEMINDKHIKILHDFANSSKLFPNVDIKGGVCYFLREQNYVGECHCYRHDETGIHKTTRYLVEEGDDIFIRNFQLISIKEKVLKFEQKTVDLITSPLKPYGLRGDVIKSTLKYNLPPMSDNPIQGGFKLLGLDEKFKRVYKYLSPDYPFNRIESLNKYKIFIPRNYGCGEIGEVPSTPVLGTPVLGTPGELCTETFIQIGCFDTKQEVENLMKYIRTKFFRTMVGIRKQDQNASRDIYRYVPLQDFTANSDIDWGQSVSEIDRQLYAKYGLSEAEVLFIENMIKPMA